MKVYIVRHGKAENEAPSRRDADRALAPRGIEQARFLGGQMARGTARPTLIVSSPVTRALETARIIHSYLHVGFETADALRVDEPVSGAVDLLTALAYPAQGPSVECLVLVGHNPQVSELCEVLVNGIGTSQFLFRTGEAMLLEVNRSSLIGSGRLLAQIRHDEEECAAPSGV